MFKNSVTALPAEPPNKLAIKTCPPGIANVILTTISPFISPPIQPFIKFPLFESILVIPPAIPPNSAPATTAAATVTVAGIQTAATTGIASKPAANAHFKGSLCSYAQSFTFSTHSGHAPFRSTSISGLFQQYPYSFNVNGSSANPLIRSLPVNRPAQGRYSLA